jgi:hypothetical protein
VTILQANGAFVIKLSTYATWQVNFLSTVFISTAAVKLRHCPRASLCDRGTSSKYIDKNGARNNVVVKALRYKLEGRGFETR